MRYLILGLEIMTLLAGLSALKAIRNSNLLILLFLMAITCTNEIRVYFFIDEVRQKYISYNVFSLLEISCWFYFFHKQFQGRVMMKWLIPIFYGMSLLFSAYELFGYRGWIRFHADSYRFFSVCMIILSVIYLSSLLTINRVFNPAKDPVFWICSGLMIFQSVFFIHLTVVNMKVFTDDNNSIKIFNTLLFIANTFYYILLCIGFYTAYQKVKIREDQFSRT